MARPGFGYPNRPFTSRNSLQDSPDLTLRTRSVIAPAVAVATAFAMITAPVTNAQVRNTKADPPVLVTAKPVISTQASPAVPGLAVLSVSPQAPAGPLQGAPKPITAFLAPFVGYGSASLLRGSLADAPVLTTADPIVISQPPNVGPGSIALVRGLEDASDFDAVVRTFVVASPPVTVPGSAESFRSSIQDAPVLTTADPITSWQPPVVVPGLVSFSRGAEDASDLNTTTASRLVISTAAPVTVPGAVSAFRASLLDASVLTTGPPIVLSQPTPVILGAVRLSQGPQAPVTSGPVTFPVVTVQASALPAAPVPWYLRGTLQDAPVLTTTEPVTVVQPSPTIAGLISVIQVSRLGAPPTIGPTTIPVVIARPSPVVLGTPTLTLRGTLQDPAVLTTPQPMVVSPSLGALTVSPVLFTRGQEDSTDFESRTDILSSVQQTPWILGVAMLSQAPPIGPFAGAPQLFISTAPQVSVAGSVFVARAPSPAASSIRPLAIVSVSAVLLPPASVQTFLRASLRDAVVLTTPAPLIIDQPAPVIAGSAFLYRNAAFGVVPVPGSVTIISFSSAVVIGSYSASVATQQDGPSIRLANYAPSVLIVNISPQVTVRQVP